MKGKTPEYVLRDRDTGRVYGVNAIMEEMPQMEKVPFAEVYPEKCMPEHIKKAVAGKAPVKKAAPAKKGLDLTTENIPKDPDEESEDDLGDEISRALGEDASRGLRD